MIRTAARKLSTQHGSAILITLALIVMLSLVGSLALRRAGTDVDLAFNKVRSDQALQLAEAGLQLSIAKLSNDLTWRAGIANEHLGNGTFSVAVLDSSSGVILGDTLILRASAVAAGAPQSVVVLETWMIPERQRIFMNTLFGGTSLRFEDNACTDSYNSDSGTYASTMDTIGGNAGSNGPAVMTGNTLVHGNLSTALNGGITMSGGSIVVGDTTSTATPQILYPIPPSDIANAQANNTSPAGVSGDFIFKSPDYLVVKTDVTLQSGVYYFTGLEVKSNANLIIAPGAQVTIYLTGKLALSGAGTMNADGAPANLVINSTGTKVGFANNSEFRGALYAPNAKFLNQDNNQVYGAITAKEVHVKNGTCVHYDRALSNLKTGPIIAYSVGGWRQI